MGKRKDVVKLHQGTLDWVKAELIAQAAAYKRDSKKDARNFFQSSDTVVQQIYLTEAMRDIVRSDLLEGMPEFLEARAQFYQKLRDDIPIKEQK